MDDNTRLLDLTVGEFKELIRPTGGAGSFAAPGPVAAPVRPTPTPAPEPCYKTAEQLINMLPSEREKYTLMDPQMLSDLARTERFLIEEFKQRFYLTYHPR